MLTVSHDPYLIEAVIGLNSPPLRAAQLHNEQDANPGLLMPFRGAGCVTGERREPDEKLERICEDKSLRLTDASCQSCLTCVLSILASREPPTATDMSVTLPEAATQPSRSLLWHTRVI